MPTAPNKALAQRYTDLHAGVAPLGLFVLGRLGDYRYYNMDDTIERALKVFATAPLSGLSGKPTRGVQAILAQVRAVANNVNVSAFAPIPVPEVPRPAAPMPAESSPVAAPSLPPPCPATEPGALNRTRDFATKRNHVVMVVMDPGFTGGPEALLQLLLAFRDAGFNVQSQGRPHEAHAKTYNVVPGVDWPVFDGHDHLKPGDVYIFPEVQYCPSALAQRGVRTFCYELAAADYGRPSRECGRIGHSIFTARYYSAAFAGIMPPYMSFSVSDVALAAFPPNATADAISAKKRNLVLVDRDACLDSGALHAALVGEFSDVEVLIARGFSREQLNAHMTEAKVVIDTCMPGVERVPIEGVLFHAVAIIGDQANGNEWLDFPLPSEFRIPQGDVGKIAEVAATVLRCHSCEDRKFDSWRAQLLNGRRALTATVDEVFTADPAFVLLACNPDEEGKALVTALSIPLTFFLASVHIIVPDVKAMRERHRDQLELLEGNGLFHSVTISAIADQPFLKADAAAGRCSQEHLLLLAPSGRALDAEFVFYTYPGVVFTSLAFYRGAVDLFDRSRLRDPKCSFISVSGQARTIVHIAEWSAHMTALKEGVRNTTQCPLAYSLPSTDVAADLAAPWHPLSSSPMTQCQRLCRQEIFLRLTDHYGLGSAACHL